MSNNHVPASKAVGRTMETVAQPALDRPSDRKAQLEQLLAACEAGDAARVARILSADGAPEVDASAEDGTTPLQVASASGCEETVRTLLMRGAALDSANHLGWTPLLHACRHGHDGVVALLLQRGAALRARTRLGVDAMVLAVRGGHTQTARLLLDAGGTTGGGLLGNGGAVTGSDGPTCELSALAVAALTGHDPLVRLLTDRGWDAGERAPSTGTTPLMCSAMNGHTMTAQALVERGCDPNVEDVNGKTAFQLAIEQGKREVRGFLDRKTTNKPRTGFETPKLDIIEATKKGDIVRLREILDENESQKDFSLPQDGITPLMYAAMSGRIDMAMLLVERCCDVNKQDSVNEWTALMHAVYYGKKSMVKYLVSAGADVNLQEKRGMTAFDMATFRDDVDKDLVRLLAAKTMRSSTLPIKKETAAKQEKTNAKAAAYENIANLGAANGEHGERTLGLKAWLNRVSNRFRNLKLTTRTFGTPSSNRRNTLADAVNTSPSKNRSTKPKITVSKSGSHEGAASSYERAALATFAAPSLHDAKKKSMSMYSLVNNPVVAAAAELEAKDQKTKIKQDAVGPFAPLPSFDTFTGYMPSLATKPHYKSASTLDLAASPRHPMTKSSSPRRGVLAPEEDGLGTSALAGSSSTSAGVAGGAPVCSSPSPDSSGGASSISTIFSGPGNSGSGCSGSGGRASSATSSTLTPSGGGHHFHHYDRYSRRTPGFVSEAPRPLLLNYLLNQPVRKGSLGQLNVAPSQTGYSWLNSVPAVGSELSGAENAPALPAAADHVAHMLPLPSIASAAQSPGLLPGSCNLNSPSQSPNLLPVAEHAQAKHLNEGDALASENEVAEADDLADVLKRLSLEHYEDIFNQQEIDMETFLTLSDGDLYELGITDADSRRQILKVASELRATARKSGR